MSDRLRELLRQRALVQEHLAWLDREIAGASDKPAEPAAQPAAAEQPAARREATSTPSSSATAVAIAARVISATATTKPASEALPHPEAILENYRVSPKTVQSDVRRGCFLYFVAAFAVLALGVTLLYFTIGSR